MNAPDQVPIKLTSFYHGGGCGCKIAPGVLQDILARSNAPVPASLLVGIETSDDAAVYKISDTQAIVATTDFFMPIVDDPHDFGAIAATNAISDVYAMGGTPLFALALVGMPVNAIPLAVIREILAGGESVCARVGIPIAGGHTIDSVEPIYGLVAIGLVHPDKVKRNAGARPGDKLVLGKPLGVGVYSAALKKQKLSQDDYRTMIASTTMLNTPGVAFAQLPFVHAMTDVTGFGLLGHLVEIWLFSIAILIVGSLSDRQFAEELQLDGFDAFYYSAVSYTSLGAEPLHEQSLRLLTAIEALTGLILITWTASFIFIVMQRTWEGHR